MQKQQFVNRYSADVARYTKEQADFAEAYTFLANSVDKELAVRGFRDDAKRMQALQFEEAQLVSLAFESGDSPAERIYELAKMRGYKPSASNGENQNETDKVAELKRTAAASRSLGGTPGAVDKGPISLEPHRSEPVSSAISPPHHALPTHRHPFRSRRLFET